MKKIHKLGLFFFFLFLGNSIYGQSCDLLYGLPIGSLNSPLGFSSLNVNTGTITTIDSIQTASGSVLGFTALDGQAGVYYVWGVAFLGGISKLYSIDISDGSIIDSPDFPPAGFTGSNGNINLLEVNEVTGELYALHWNSNLSQEFFVTIDPNNGAVTIIDSIPNVNLVQLSFSALDSQNGVFYFVGGVNNANLKLYSIDISTGAVIANPNFPPSGFTGNIVELNINPLTEQLYALNSISGSSTGLLLNIDPNTGSASVVDSIPNFSPVPITSSTIQPHSNVYSFIHSGNLYSVNLNSGGSGSISNPNNITVTPISPGNLRELHSAPPISTPQTEYIHVSQASICNVDSALLSVSGNYGSYLWSNGDTTSSIYVSDSAQYSVSLTTNAGCPVSSNDVSVNVYDCSRTVDSLNYFADSCGFDPADVILAYAENITVSNDTVYLDWYLMLNTGDTIILDANYYFGQNGIHTISIAFDCNGQRSNYHFFYDLIDIDHITSVVGLENNEWNPLDFSIYPNPSSDRLTILSNNTEQAKPDKISILNINGKLLKTISNASDMIDVSDLPSGIYFLNISVDQQAVTKKFVKR